jgi:hypothetical protein
MFIACTDTISLANNLENTLRTIKKQQFGQKNLELLVVVDSLNNVDAWVFI